MKIEWKKIYSNFCASLIDSIATVISAKGYGTKYDISVFVTSIPLLFDKVFRPWFFKVAEQS